MTAHQLAKDLIEEYTDKKTGKCRLSKGSLSRLLPELYPSEFKNVETARTIIRRVTGASGKALRETVKTRIEWKGLQLPEPDKNDYSKFIIREKRVGILSDIHFPHYDKIALDTAIKYLKSWKPYCILLNGDIIDCYHLSNWERDPRQRDFNEELDIVCSFILQLGKLFPGVRIIWKLGNHEDRYEKKILQRVPELVKLKLFDFDAVVRHYMQDVYKENLKVDFVKNKRLMMIGKLNVGHGHELLRGIAAPVNPARGFYMKTKSNFLGGHHHQISEHTEPDINEQIVGTWSTGCLCDLHPDYMPLNKWSHGFATVENFGSDFEVNNKKIIKGKVM
jgi:predicted phosphodiesterase